MQVPKEERDKVQKLHVLTRAAAALAAVDALLASNPARKPPPKPENPAPSTTGTPQWVTTSTVEVRVPALQQRPLSAGIILKHGSDVVRLKFTNLHYTLHFGHSEGITITLGHKCQDRLSCGYGISCL